MHVTFHGAVREVTGSMHLITAGRNRILLDCGMFQGRRREAAAKNRILPFDPAIITNTVLSHAHIDHSGRIPLLTRNGYNGRVLCTRVTRDACAYLLPDSAHIQESDANYLNYKTVRTALSRLESERGKSRKEKNEARDLKRRLKREGHRLNSDVINELIKVHRLESTPRLKSQKRSHAMAEQRIRPV